jgi:ATP adenylyltransferase
MRALRRVLNCQGFNTGINTGAAAGAGVADHMHLHIVPRWGGDANFMPVIAGTTVMPEALSVTYGRIRAELLNELGEGYRPESHRT